MYFIEAKRPILNQKTWMSVTLKDIKDYSRIQLIGDVKKDIRN